MVKARFTYTVTCPRTGEKFEHSFEDAFQDWEWIGLYLKDLSERRLEKHDVLKVEVLTSKAHQKPAEKSSK